MKEKNKTICLKCKNENPENAVFCNSCGSPIAKEKTTELAKVNKSMSRKKWFMRLTVVLSILFGISFAVFVFRGMSVADLSSLEIWGVFGFLFLVGFVYVWFVHFFIKFFIKYVFVRYVVGGFKKSDK